MKLVMGADLYNQMRESSPITKKNEANSVLRNSQKNSNFITETIWLSLATFFAHFQFLQTICFVREIF